MVVSTSVSFSMQEKLVTTRRTRRMKRLSEYDERLRYEVGEKVWIVDAGREDEFLRKTPDELVKMGRIESLFLMGKKSGKLGALYRVYSDPPQVKDELPEHIYATEALARQYCIAHAIELVDKKLEKLEGDIKYAQSQVRVYTEKREKFYKQLKESAGDVRDQ
jgi:hypothetical protein